MGLDRDSNQATIKTIRTIAAISAHGRFPRLTEITCIDLLRSRAKLDACDDRPD
jgi:hypothetical protein